MEVDSDTLVSSLRRWMWGELPQGYLALRLWRLSGLPLHPRSRRCTPPNLFSFSSLQTLKQEEREQTKKKGEVAHLEKGRERRDEKKHKKNNSSNIF